LRSSQPKVPSGDSRVIGLLPAAGRARRISPLPCSKEILPLGFQTDGRDGLLRPKVVSQYLLEKMRRAGAMEVYLIIRRGKWDIPQYYGDGSQLGLSIAYLLVHEPYGAPFTLDQAHVFARGATVLFGFPDILFQPQDAFLRARRRLDATRADAVVGLFPAHPSERFDLCRTDARGRVTQLETRCTEPGKMRRPQVWVFAVWRSTFTEFLHAEVARLRALALNGDAGADPEWTIGATIDAAIRMGLHVDSVRFDSHRYLDIGEPDRFATALRGPGAWGDPRSKKKSARRSSKA
jgi:glucose-1-phosphate thymidylyltransferase